MKKILLLLSIPLFAFQCEIDEPKINECNCFNEVVYINDGIDTVLIERTEAESIKCELWGLADNYAPMKDSEFLSRYKCE